MLNIVVVIRVQILDLINIDNALLHVDLILLDVSEVNLSLSLNDEQILLILRNLKENVIWLVKLGVVQALTDVVDVNIFLCIDI